jgi:hypothetical protein
MWMLNRLKPSNYDRMSRLGFSLTPEQLYDTINPSLKDAVVIFGGGCTGVTVSDNGLIFTNHHCGRGAIQSQSSVEHDYLTDGFVSQSFDDELPIEGLSVRYLLKTVDVTDSVLAVVTPDMTERERQQAIFGKCSEIERENENDSLSISARVSAYFAGNEYYLNVYQIVTDVRLVFAPPSSVGNFGGDTDNWMWPRQTGDFSVFRAYSNPEGKKGYHKENQPYRPRYVAPVSTEGYAENSFAMTIGFPGSTQRYLTSWGVEQRIHGQNAPRIEVRGEKQAIWWEAMLASPKVRIEYTSKFEGSSNYWKNSIGMNRGLERMKVVARKQALEKEFTDWVNASEERTAKYGAVLPTLAGAYTSTTELTRISTYLAEAFPGGAEIVRLALSVGNIDVSDPARVADAYERRVLPVYKDYEPTLDEKVLAAMMTVVKKNVPAANLPTFYKEADGKYKGDYAKFVAALFSKSVIPYPEKVKALIMNPKKAKNLKKDPAVVLAQSAMDCINSLRDQIGDSRSDIGRCERLFLAGLREMNPSRDYPADANSTMRMSYGSVGGYRPFDGAWYDYFSTTSGVLEKYKENDPEFHLQPELLTLLGSNDFGRWGKADGGMNVDFLSNNDITGGNSGSPIFDGRGRLIGLAFDGNWEAMSGDIAFETDVQRCIGVDVRYMLFIIDRWGHCQRLIDELKLQ